MNKFKFYFIVFTASVLFFSCTKDDPANTIEPPRDYAEQYPKDIAIIEDYLKSNYFTVINHPGFVDDQDITIKKIDAGQPSIYSYLDSATYPKLLVRTVNMHNVEKGYKLYYLVLRPGVGVSPCNVDGVLASYRGTYLERSTATTAAPSEVTATFFEELKYPQTTLNLYGVIKGWSEIFPQFKTGTATINTNGTVNHNDFGAGVMFIPSGLAYYNIGSGEIPSYSPLVFSFKLYTIERLDQDDDGVFSYQEDQNNDGYVYDFRNTNAYPTTPENLDDTDKDAIPDFLDVDDDGDNYTTKLEITKPVGTNSGLSLYFPFDPIVDDPFTTAIETETKGIPSYDATKDEKFDYTTPGRLRIHLDNNYPVKKL
ncbi:FKBP-type peptidylprolyl isomerase [Flavobacterium sp.]|uniref:FKBP-type peptidyl-prolyl cis-trans isomerase n=1 Tax=Flavobacterium sp. TaxID=239 RepID=UPI00286DE441|nr:FKBP-type peptidylprolyl isomerase [Flavobacterium sp.]